MIISHIIGGLGNQMFQYAMGRAVAIANEDLLKLDISGFSNYELHQGFELQRIFNCSFEVATEDNFRSALGWQSARYIRRILLKREMSVFRGKGFVIEPHFEYWDGIKKIPSNVFTIGYWQSEKYFLSVAAQIRNDFTFCLPFNDQNSEIAKQIEGVNAVSLHVRRGDYVNNPTTTATHGLCSLDYYQKAISYISERVEKPEFFVFSDDIEWVKNHLRIGFPCQYVDHNLNTESYNDMRLMSLCQHNIIANSSFSWWGAWLNSRANKIVTAPKTWFANGTNTQDLLPDTWIRL